MNPHSRLSAAFLRDHSAAAARALEDFPAESVAKLLAASSPVTAEQVIEHFTPGYAASCLLSFEPKAAGQLFANFIPELQIMLLRQLDQDKRESLLGALKAELAASMRRLLPYPEGTAGALMEAPLTSVPEELSVRDALRRIKRMRRGMKFYVYVINAQGQPTGVLTLHELINARPSAIVSQVAHRDVISLSAMQPIRTVINSPYWQDYHALPVTDDNNILLGVIRQKIMRRFQEQSVQADAVSSGLGTIFSVGELFTVSSAHLLSALVSAGAALTRNDYRD